MSKNTAPTKGNLMAAQNTLRLAKRGFEMLDKKRNISIREMMLLIDEAKQVQAGIESSFNEAYHALERANIMMGVDNVRELMHSIKIEDSVTLHLRGVMGVELPVVGIAEQKLEPEYDFFSTGSALDEAYVKFNEVKHFTVRLAEIENAVYRLAMNIKKTQKRANALKNITIPLYEKLTKDMQNVLEEKEREEHTRLKIIKKTE